MRDCCLLPGSWPSRGSKRHPDEMHMEDFPYSPLKPIGRTLEWGGLIQMSKFPMRAEVPVEQTWNLSDLYATPDDFEEDLADFPTRVSAIRAFQGRLGEGSGIFLNCLDTHLRILEQASRLYAYAFDRVSADGLSIANQEAHSRAVSAMTLASTESAFIVPEILSLPAGIVEGYLETEPGLAPWRRWLERLMVQRSHLLPSQTEKALAALGEVLGFPGSIYRLWRTADLKFPEVRGYEGQVHQMTLPHYERVLERSADTALRRDAYKALVDSLNRYRNTVAAMWATQVKANVTLARLRGYGSAIEMKLSEQDVPEDLYDRLHEVILAELAPHMRKLTQLRKRVLGLDRVLYCDIEADLDPGYSPVSSFGQAREAIVSGVSVLGGEYTDIIRSAFTDRWIDWANNEGKTGDCFSGGGAPHPYILIGWDGTMRSTMILAHELGHAAHQHLTWRNQKGYNRGTSLLIDEAASTTMEAIVGDWLMRHSDSPRARRWFISHLLTSYYHNFVRHLIESELQRRLYAMAERDVPITADLLCKVQGDILTEFWGGAVTIDDGARLTWMRQIHYYDQRLYSWSYAGGLTIGVAVVKAIHRDGSRAAERWVQALKAGGSLPPLELARLAGADLTGPGAMREAVEYVGRLIDELERGF